MLFITLKRWFYIRKLNRLKVKVDGELKKVQKKLQKELGDSVNLTPTSWVPEESENIVYLSTLLKEK